VGDCLCKLQEAAFQNEGKDEREVTEQAARSLALRLLMNRGQSGAHLERAEGA